MTFLPRGGVVGWVVLALAGVLAATAGAEGRVPWTSSHVTGTPEPPPPFRLERAYPKLKFTQPVDMDLHAGRWFVVEQGGKIFSFAASNPSVEQPDLVIDLKESMLDWTSVPGCRGLDGAYGIAFDPRFAENRFVYVCYALAFGKKPTEPIGTRVSRFTMSGEPPRFDAGSERVVIEWHAGGHNGGCLKFGPDGMLYISAGDQADPNPPDANQTGQDISDLRSSILRIDVAHAGEGTLYAVPPDNPFVKIPGARGEVWAYGLRNPWRMSFDRATGRLWVADVGWELWESVYCASSGGNYGWSVMEGPNPVNIHLKRGPTPITPPAVTLSHAESASITGGFVYRGKRYAQLAGQYVFGDWETRRIWAAKLVGADRLEPHRTIAQTDARVVAFAEDADGELYVVDYESGGLFSLVPDPAATHTSAFPRTLSATGLFVGDVAEQRPAAGVVPFDVNVSQWVDGATAERFAAIPSTQTIGWITNDVYSRLSRQFPEGSVLARTLSLETRVGDPSTRRRVETQLLHFDGKQWHAYGYRWRDDGRDADLVEEGGAERVLTVEDPLAPGGKREQVWRFSSRAQCLTCHNSWAGYALGFADQQLDRAARDGGEENQLEAMRRTGLLSGAYQKPAKGGGPDTPKAYTLVDPYDDAKPLEDRARSYLHVNCSVCHRMGGGGAALIDVRREMTPRDTHAIDATPLLGAFGIDDARIVKPGDPGRSVMLYRMTKGGSGHMPKIGSERVDDRGVAMMARWIAGMKESQTPPPQAGPTIDDARVESALGSTRGALELAVAIHAGEPRDPAARAKVVARGLASTTPAVRDLFTPFVPRGNVLGPRFDRAKLLAMPGDAARGLAVFQSVAQCATCHQGPGVQGKEFGPDLTHIAAKYPTKPQLLENLVEPSKTIAEGYEGWIVETADGDAVTGIRVSRTDKELVLRDATGQPVHIPAAQIKAERRQALSIMPEGLLDNLEPQQAADLLAWLAERK